MSSIDEDLAEVLQSARDFERSVPALVAGRRDDIVRDVSRVADTEKQIGEVPLEFFTRDSKDGAVKWRLKPISDKSGSFSWSLDLSVSDDELMPSNTAAALGDKEFHFVAICISRWCVLVTLKVIPNTRAVSKCPKLVFKSNPTRSLIRLNVDEWCLPCVGGNIDDPVLRKDGELRRIAFPPIPKIAERFEITFGQLVGQASWEFDSEGIPAILTKVSESRSLADQLREFLNGKLDEMKSEHEARIHRLKQKAMDLAKSQGLDEHDLQEPKSSDGKWPF